MHLIHITHFHGLAHLERTLVCRLHTHDHAEQGRLTCTVRTNHAYDAVGRQHEVQVLKQHAVAVGFGYAFGVDDLVAQTRTVRNEYLQLLLTHFLLLVQHAVVRTQTGFRLGLTSLRRHAYPFQLALQGLPTLRGLLLLHRHSRRFLLQPRRVVALPWDTLAAIQLQDPSGYVVQEVAVVGDADHRSGILLQVLLQPVNRLSIQVVGRLVQQQYIGLLQ